MIKIIPAHSTVEIAQFAVRSVEFNWFTPPAQSPIAMNLGRFEFVAWVQASGQQGFGDLVFNFVLQGAAHRAAAEHRVETDTRQFVRQMRHDFILSADK